MEDETNMLSNSKAQAENGSKKAVKFFKTSDEQCDAKFQCITTTGYPKAFSIEAFLKKQ